MAQHPSTIGLRLVSAAEADRDRLATLINAAFDVYPFMGGPRTSPAGVAEELGTTGVFIVAEDDGRIVGCAMLRPASEIGWDLDSPPTGLSGADVVYLGLVAVDPTIRKLGLGKRIIVEAERTARSRGFAKVALGTLAEQHTVPYYEALGYRTVASQQFEAGHWEQTIPHEFCVMVKAL
jgi:predicted N-acetyltransferase YhbS